MVGIGIFHKLEPALDDPRILTQSFLVVELSMKLDFKLPVNCQQVAGGVISKQ